MLKTVSTQLALASDTLPEVLAKGNTTGGTDLAVSSGDDITFADNSKAIFGAGSDISIYSDGSTGQVSGDVNVIGTVTVEDATTAVMTLSDTSSANQYSTFSQTGGNLVIESSNNNNRGTFRIASADGTDSINRLFVSTGGDVSFYNTAGTDAKMVWDASAESLVFSGTGGVYLGGTAAANLLDDYEEGSWSPAVNAYSGTPTTSGYYTKIGQQVTLEGSVQLDGTADASIIRFSNFPFTVASPYLGGAYLTYNSGGVADVIVNIDSSSRLELRNSSGTQLSFDTIGVSALLTFVVSYRSA